MLAGLWVERLLPFVPDASQFAMGLLMGLVTIVTARRVAVAGVQRGLRSGDTRKIFHVIVFSAAAAVRWFAGMGALTVFGVIVAGTVLNSVRLQGTSLLFKALARPQDEPYQAWYVVVPLCATACGGVAAQLLGGRLAVVGLLVSAWGDAVGEPVGSRWGKHKYRVPSLKGVECTRSVEGSAAVFVASLLASVVGLMLLGLPHASLWWMAAVVAFAATVVETISPHGQDNFTVPVVAVGTLLFLGVS